jgi:hypothetical protein
LRSHNKRQQKLSELLSVDLVGVTVRAPEVVLTHKSAGCLLHGSDV